MTRDSILRDYRLAVESRQVSLVGRREVLTGKAKFGIFGDGKEVAQVAMARCFRPGDHRSGYYRDQTLMFALGIATIEEFFAQLYADADVVRDPHSGGRSMSAHFGSRLVRPDGSWRDQLTLPNTSSDVSPTASQMPRLVGLAYASRLYREIPTLAAARPGFSNQGNEIAWGTIGNASTAEGMFWEAINAAGVLQGPLLMSIWDDGYGISVPNEFQVVSDLSRMLTGFRRAPGVRGYDLYTVPGWDYPALCETYRTASEIVRREQVPAIIHVTEMTQPQGHSTSGSHERYKSRERLEWEADHDPITRMRAWILAQGAATAGELDALEEEATQRVRSLQRKSWDACRAPIESERAEVLRRLAALAAAAPAAADWTALADGLRKQQAPLRRDLAVVVREALFATRAADSAVRAQLLSWQRMQDRQTWERYASDLYGGEERSALRVPEVKAVYADSAPTLNGFEVLNACFDAALARLPHLFAMGEDLGQLGDVNQGFLGLQAKYGALRVADTGIRETTILGQAIGMAMRGLRPIAEIQYLDYILYCLQLLSDDLATLRWRTAGGQKAPVIVRTRGHRLEGIWHSGSPMAGLLNLVRGIWVCVPRDMTQAAGFYNTLLAGDDPAIVIEVLNGYRVKERLPANIGEFTVPLGVPEVLREGSDVTVVTYGACCRIALDAAAELERTGISAEIVDVQTLLPFDRRGIVLASLKKTHRILFLDEDVPGGATAFLMQQVLDAQNGYPWLDAQPRCLAATEHRPAYGSDGDYWSKPNRETVFEAVYELMHEGDPARFPIFWR
jgi:pyruvate/2-oxoglutarate/acetoin dehydrogenase E1 component/TPP-dependent pyruvate/acetoin dehydrogenase alpha subunit